MARMRDGFWFLWVVGGSFALPSSMIASPMNGVTGNPCLQVDSPRGGAEEMKAWKQVQGAILRGVAAGDVESVLDRLPQLSQFDTPETARLIIDHLVGHENLLVHQDAIRVLTRLRNSAAQQPVIAAAAGHRAWEIRAHCVRVLGYYKGEFALAKVEAALVDRKWQVRSAAIRTLAQMRRRTSIPLLIDRLQADTGRIRHDLAWALQRLTGVRFDGEYSDWHGWWVVNEDTFEMPTLNDVERQLDTDRPRSLTTAVSEGLYGPVYSEHIAFLLDVSGSMSVGTDLQGNRAQIATRELEKLIQNRLSKSTRFNVIAFANETFPFRKRIVAAKPATIKKAKGFLATLAAGGETNAYGALRAAFDDPGVDTIYFLSDGTPTVGEEVIPEIILHRVSEWNRDRRIVINCIGFFPGIARNESKAEARTFLRHLANRNEGFYKEIY